MTFGNKCEAYRTEHSRKWILEIRTTGSEGVVLQSCRKNLHSLEAVRAAKCSQRRVCSFNSLLIYVHFVEEAGLHRIDLT